MAEIEHIQKLCRGVEYWNEARAKEGFEPDLSQIEILDATLSGINFAGVEFDGARFRNVEAKQADFRRARLNGVMAVNTIFQGSNLRDAELMGADFFQSSARNADMSGAKSRDLRVRHSDFSGVRLRGAQLSKAHFYNNNFLGADFGDAHLERASIRRFVIDEHCEEALIRSGADTELLNDPCKIKWIDWQNYSIADHGADFGSILYRNQLYWINEGRWDFFVSHASVDKEALATPIAEALQNLGQDVWLDVDEVRVGDDLTTVLNRGTRGSLFGVIVASENFFGREWTEFELKALERKRLFLVLHELTPEKLTQMRPELAGRVTISSELGPERIAQALVEAIRAPRSQDA